MAKKEKKKYPRVEFGTVGGNLVITIPGSLIKKGIIDPKKEYEIIIAPRETFLKEFGVSFLTSLDDRGEYDKSSNDSDVDRRIPP